jgi:hypothetical protein
MFRLEQNYRSSKNIVEAANNVIDKNKTKLDKIVWTANDDGPKIKVHRSVTDGEEGRFVAGTIFEQKMQNQLPNSHFAILYRTNAQSRAMEDALRKRDIPYRIYGGLSFYQRKEIKDVLSYLRLVINPKDEEALVRVINYPARGIGDTTVEKLTVAANHYKRSIFEVMEHIDKIDLKLNSGTKTKLQDFVTMIKSFQVINEQQDAFTLTDHVTKKTGLVQELKKDGTPEGIARIENIEELENGTLDIIIGTHALLEDKVQFKNLGLAVIDEQHRFGVEQRSKLWRKSEIPPHVLVMTATPIPRTLAMSLYGDLDISVIDELPPGRKPIQTVHRFDSKRLVVWKFIKDEIAKGRQIYIVYPLIQESEKMDYKDLMDGYESISRDFPLPQYSISILHGKMKPADKDEEMKRFAEGKTNIMVATTVIEVGVNIPNASVMVIESAERFGLSQLHQLRGRVGRGAEQSYCILMTDYKLSEDSKTRMETMVRTNDGFEIAEVDLKLRGPGDIMGKQQSGVLNLQIADLVKDRDILQVARHIAVKLLKEDPGMDLPQHEKLKAVFMEISKKKSIWNYIS